MENQLVFAATLVGQTVTDILTADQNGDGKISRGEILSLIAPLGMRLMTSFPQIDFKELATEIRTSDTEVRQAAINAVNKTFDIADDHLELIIEDVIDLVEDVYTDVEKHVTSAIDIAGRIKARKQA